MHFETSVSSTSILSVEKKYPNEIAYLRSKFSRSQSISTGEAVLLAMAIADSFPICSSTQEFENTFDGKRLSIQRVCDLISNFVFVPSCSEVTDLVKSLLAWRHSVAYNPSYPAFILGRNSFIDELTRITNFVSCDVLCQGGDYYTSAGKIYQSFRAVASEYCKGTRQ